VECGETSDDAPFYPCSVASFMETLDIVPSLTWIMASEYVLVDRQSLDVCFPFSIISLHFKLAN
jgi:hypothetical protein